MTSPLPWSLINPPTHDLNVLLVDGVEAVRAYWARDAQGRRLFVIRLEGDHRRAFVAGRVPVRGLDTDLWDDSDPGCQRLVLALSIDADVELFHVLCVHLASDLGQARTSEQALSTVLQHLRRWKTFFANPSGARLSSEQIRGLIAELWFLEALAGSSWGGLAAVRAWLGPDRVQQDFVFGDRAVEVKSISAADPGTVRISSENQLETVGSRLFLLTIRLDEDAAGRSLNHIVASTRDALPGAAVEEFDNKVASAGYQPLPDYDTPTFLVAAPQAYLVGPGFPRLVRSELAAGVCRVSYQLLLEHLSGFRAPISAVLGESLDAANP